jgi:hypothetical protein
MCEVCLTLDERPTLLWIFQTALWSPDYRADQGEHSGLGAAQSRDGSSLISMIQEMEISWVSIPVDQANPVEELARAMVEDILESSSPEEISQLIEEMETKLRKAH